MSTITLSKVFAALPQADKGKAVRLSGDPSGENVLYCNGRNVYIRNLKDPSQADVYTGHLKPTTVARYSPSRRYIASADISGKVLIWGAVSSEHPLKAEYPALSGLIKDLDWSPDSQYIVVCGNSNEKFANVLSVDSGTPLGTLEGHSKIINTCSYRQVRPFYIVTASEDNTVGFHQGPSFKLKGIQKFHINFAQVARYSRNGNTVLSGGANGKLYKYDGNTLKESETKEIGTPAHKADIYELCYSPDDNQVLTVSRDRTAKVFDVQSGTLVQEFTFDGSSKDWQDMQLGCLWQNGELLTVNARGHLIYHSLETPLQPKRVVKGHMKPITAMAVSEDGTTIFTGNQEGIIWWDAETGSNDDMKGSQQTIDIVDMVIDNDDLIYLCRDDTVRFACASARVCSERLVKLDSQPTAVAARNGFIVVACVQHLTALAGKLNLSSIPVKSQPTSVSIHPEAATAAVGHKDKRIRIYSLQSSSVHETRIVEMHGEVNVVAFSPSGVYLAVGAERRVSALSATDYKELSKGEVHCAPVCCVAWSPDSSCFVTSSLDGKVVLWDDVNESYKRRPSIQAHVKSHANSIAWLNATTFVTAGQDSNIKQFTITS